MSVSKLTKIIFIVLVISVFSAFALGMAGRRLAMAAFAIPSAASIGFLIFLVFRRVLHPLLLLTATMKAAGDKGLSEAPPWVPVEAPDDEFGELAACCNRLYAGLYEMAAERKKVLSSFPGPVIGLDRDGRVTELNGAALDIGIPDIRDRSFSSIIPSGRAAGFEAAFKDALGDGQPKTIEFPLKLDGGRVNLFVFSVTPLKRSGSSTEALLIGRDMEECGKLAEELAAVRSEAKDAEDKLNGTIRDLEEFALMAVRREIKMKEIREKLTELRQGRDAK